MKIAVVKMLGFGLGLIALAAAAAAAPRPGLFADDRTLGDPKAPVMVVEYLAPTCPHCAHFAANVFPDIKKDYIDTGKVLYVLRIFPLGPADGAIAGLAKCQKPERYYEFLDLAFRKQAMWDPDGYDIPDVYGAIIKLAGMADLKPDQAKRCMDDQIEMDRVNRIADDASDRFGIHSVPTLMIDGTRLPIEDMTAPALKQRIDALLASKPK